MKRESFNDGWSFSKDNSSLASEVTGNTEVETETVTLPHDAMVWEKRSEMCAAKNAGGFYPGGNYIYTKTFIVSNQDAGKSLILEFEGVYNQARVFVNNDFVCSNHYGYTGFYADITPYLRYGEENTVMVKVTNGSVPNSRWYTGSGIYRPVYLLKGNAIRVKPDGLKITTPDVEEDISLVETETHLQYDGKITQSIHVFTKIKDSQGNTIATEKTPVTLYADENPVIYQRIYVRDARLWSSEVPYLYTCEVELLQEKNTLDCVESKFGIRKIQIDPVHGLRINGENVLLRGSCIHHDNGMLGAATFARAEERRVEISKAAGFNALRIAHNTASKALLDACDRIGMLVIDESFDMWNHSKSMYDYALDFSEYWEKDVDAIVAKDYNHPCVIMYSIGNEIQEAGTPAGARWNRNIANKFRSADPTRLITNALNGLLTIMNNMLPVMVDLGMLSKEQMDAMTEGEEKQGEGGDINDVMTALMGQMNYLTSHHSVTEKLEESCSGLDVCGYNYMRDSYKKDARNYPNRITYGSETLPPDIDLNWKCCKEIPNTIGDFTWTGWDYIGEAGIGIAGYEGVSGFLYPYPAYLAYVGDIDITGYRRPMSYYREIVFGLRKEPYISVQFPEHYHQEASCTPWVERESIASWTWSGYEGKPVKVEVYSDAEEVELFCNGESIGKGQTGEDNRFKAVFDTVYYPGKLEAVSYRNGQEAEHFLIKTARCSERVQVKLDKTQAAADGQDLIYAEIQLMDAEGNLNMQEQKKVNVELEGPIELAGFGSANPLSTENFFDKERTTFNGRAVAVLRTTKESGTACIKVRAADVRGDEASISVS